MDRFRILPPRQHQPGQSGRHRWYGVCRIRPSRSAGAARSVWPHGLQPARHNTKAIELWQQGDITYILNDEPGSHGREFVAQHGPCALDGLAWWMPRMPSPMPLR